MVNEPSVFELLRIRLYVVKKPMILNGYCYIFNGSKLYENCLGLLLINGSTLRIDPFSEGTLFVGKKTKKKQEVINVVFLVRKRRKI